MAHKRYTSGFTLMELMIALALGLLIVAAGLAVFLSSQRSLGLQSGMSELQQNANFGMSLVTHDLRHTNLNTASSHRVNNYDEGSGIIFKKENLPTALRATANLEAEFVTLQNKDTDNTTGKSDRLTIQYTPATSTIFNCEGVQVTNAYSKTIVQRYYVAESPQQVAGEPTSYSLYCDAASYDGAGLVGLNTNAQQIMQRVDAFKVRLGVKNPAGQLRYMTIDQYIAAMETIRAACATPIDEGICAKTYLNVVSINLCYLFRILSSVKHGYNVNFLVIKTIKNSNLFDDDAFMVITTF